ncbi:NfeD family protein [Magnetovibrio sp.]|uniref:NfeD family protein n=1 Tax=Magnetovibrio sp. TaxID=2024836 RepID=UPI002F92F63C
MSVTFFDEITFWHWLIAGVILIALEMAVPGVVFMWIGIAAIITGGVAWASPDLAFEWLLIIFAVLSVLSVVLGRTYLKRHPLQSDHPKLNRRGEQYVGRHFTLSEPIVGGFGKIKVDDSTWKVAGEDMPQGAKVEVVAVDGVVLKVEARD